MGGWRFYLLIVHFKLGVKLLLCRVWPHVRSELRIRSRRLEWRHVRAHDESEGPSFMTDLCGVCNRSPRSELIPADEPAAASTLQSFTAWSFRFRRIPSECLDKNEGVGGWCGDRGAAGSGCSVHLRTRRLPASLEGGEGSLAAVFAPSLVAAVVLDAGGRSHVLAVWGGVLSVAHIPLLGSAVVFLHLKRGQTFTPSWPRGKPSRNISAILGLWRVLSCWF